MLTLNFKKTSMFITMKKILHLSHTEILTDSRILKEIRAARNIGYAVYGIGLSSRNENSNRKIVDEHILSINLISRNFIFFPKIIRHFLSYLEFNFKLLINIFKFKPDLIHCNDVYVLPIGVVMKYLLRTKLIYDAHELESNKNGQTKLSSRLVLFAEKFLWKAIDALIVVSPSIKKWYFEHLGPKETEVILNSPVVINKYEAKTTYLRDFFKIPSGSKIFIYIGGFMPGRGLDLIVDVFSKPSVKSSLVLMGYGELQGRLENIADNIDNIFVHAGVPHDQVVPIAKSADFGLCLIENVSLSDYYSLPNKLFEYCFSGIPVLASNFPDIAEIVEKYDLGMCCESKTDSILKCVQSIEEKGYSKTIDLDNLNKFSWEYQSFKLVALYKNVLNDIM